MEEPASSIVRAKLEEHNAKLGDLSSSLADRTFDLEKAEKAHTSGMWQVMYVIPVSLLFFILAVFTNSWIFIILAFSVFGIAFMYGYDEKRGEAKINSIKSNIGNINSEITALQTSIGNINAAMVAEENLDYRKAIDLFDQVGLGSEAKRIRKKMTDEGKVKVDQTVVHGDVVHGDYIDDRDTIVKDSVLNRSNVGVGGDDKFTKLKELTEMKEKGLIDDAEFKQMKKEILGFSSKSISEEGNWWEE